MCRSAAYYCKTSQKQRKRPVGYRWCSLTKAKRAYNTFQRKCLAIVCSVLPLRLYLKGTLLIIRNDLNLLWWFLNLEATTGRRWWIRLSEFDFEVVHRDGVKHQAVEAQSRIPTDGTDNKPLEEEFPALGLAGSTKMDDTTTTIFALEANKNTPANSVTNTDGTDTTPPTLAEFINAQFADELCKNATRWLSQIGTEFKFNKDGALVRRAPIDIALQKLVQQSLRQRLLNLSNPPSLCGHPGQRCMYDTIRRVYYWPNMASNVCKTESSCQLC